MGAGKGSQARKEVTDWREVQRPVPRVEIGPRWCRFCQINKPDRTHHCRHCGTCVSQFDRKFLISPPLRKTNTQITVCG